MTKLLLLALSLPVPALLVGSAVAEEGLPALSTLTVPSIVIILLVLLNGLYVLAEFAIIGVRPTQMEQLAKEGNRTARAVSAILRSPDRQNEYLATAQLGITIASLGLGMYGEAQLAHFIEPYLAHYLGLDLHSTFITTLGYIIGVGVLTYLHIVFGEMIPKSLALTSPDRSVLAANQPMRLSQMVLFIPVRVLNGLGNQLLHLFRIPPAGGHARLHSTEELEQLVSESAESGLLGQSEEELLRNIFDFSDRYVSQVMTPRPRVEAIAHDTPLPKLMEQVVNSQHSRFPVYEHNLDQIIGVLHFKDMVRQQVNLKGSFDLRLLLRPVLVVPEHYPVEKLLATFKRQRVHLAVVLDEYGGTAGIVTLEDLVEEVLGEVRDEFDQESEPFVQPAPGVVEVVGHYLLDELRQDIDLGDEEDLPDIETVGGLIMTELGRLPQTGDSFTFKDNIRFTVLAVDGLTVARARIEYPELKEKD